MQNEVDSVEYVNIKQTLFKVNITRQVYTLC